MGDAIQAGAIAPKALEVAPRSAPGFGLTIDEPFMAEQLEAIAASIRSDAGPGASIEDLVRAGGVSIRVPGCHCAKLAADRAEKSICGPCQGLIWGLPMGLCGRGAEGLAVPSWEVVIPANAGEVAGEEYAARVAWFAAMGVLRMRGLGARDTVGGPLTGVTSERETARADYLARALLLPAADFLAALGALVERERWHFVGWRAAQGELDEHGYGDLPARLRASFPDACESVIVERLTDVTRLAFVVETTAREPELAQLRAAAQASRVRSGDARGRKVATTRFYSPAVARAIEALSEEDEIIGDGAHVDLERTFDVRGLDLELGKIVRDANLTRGQAARIFALASFVIGAFCEDGDDRREAERVALRTLDVLDGRVSISRFESERGRIGGGPVTFAALLGAFLTSPSDAVPHLYARDLARACADGEVPCPAWAATCLLDFVSACIGVMAGHGGPAELVAALGHEVHAYADAAE